MIINSSPNLYGVITEIEATLTAAASFGVSFTPSIGTVSVRVNTAFEAVFTANLSPIARKENSFIARAHFNANFNPSVALTLIQPAPILNEIALTAFVNQNYAVRLIRNNIEIPFKSANVSAPAGSVGKSLSVEFTGADETIFDVDAVFTLEIGKRTNGAVEWHTVFDSGAASGKGFQTRWANDTLSISAVESLTDKLSLCPRRNLSYENANINSGIKTALDLDVIYDTEGGAIKSIALQKTILSLYDALNYAFVNGCGFSSVVTNIPNFEITRVDFSITNTYLESVSGLIGVFEPVFFNVGNVLYILDKTAAIPEEFEPRPITASEYPSFSRQIPQTARIDGLLIEYSQTNNSNYYTQRFETETKNSGVYGTSDYTTTVTTREFRDYRQTDNPAVIVRSELKSQTIITKNASLAIIGEETEFYAFDSKGKTTLKTKTIKAFVPNLADNGNLLLQTTREETQNYSYKTDRFDASRSIMSQCVTEISALIAVDADNQYLDADFKQEFMEAHRAGNLSVGMATYFGTVKTVIEDFEQTSREQARINTRTIDYLRNGAAVVSVSETRNGSLSINDAAPTAKKMIVWRTGVNTSASKGSRIASFAVGELPLRFAIPLATRKLAAARVKHTGTVDVAGFDESIERGVFFDVEDRTGTSYGTYIAEGYDISINGLGTPQARITTRLNVSEI